MNRVFDRLIIMIATILVIPFWIVIALAPIALMLFLLRMADRRQRKRSKHLRLPDSLDH